MLIFLFLSFIFAPFGAVILLVIACGIILQHRSAKQDTQKIIICLIQEAIDWMWCPTVKVFCSISPIHHKFNDASLLSKTRMHVGQTVSMLKWEKKLLLSLFPDLVFPFKMYLSQDNILVLCSRKVNMGIQLFILMENSMSWQFF